MNDTRILAAVEHRLASDVVTAEDARGDGYRECQRDIQELIASARRKLSGPDTNKKEST